MIERPIWRERVLSAWRKVPIAWLTGPRRVGKTVLAQTLDDVEFLNCDLPSVHARLNDPERFFRSVRSRHVVFDEVHQLPNPSQVLKIGADAFPKLRILATGSSTLAATQKFRDSLTGRKRAIRLVPVLFEELAAFGIRDPQVRLLRGGLPPALLAERHDPEFYGEWLDSYFARDVQELFHLEKRAAFLRTLQLLLRQSGGMLNVSNTAAHCGVSRPTILNWLEVMEVTHAICIVRPYSAGGRREIVAQPKVFGFDTGFVCHARGWDQLRPEDCGGSTSCWRPCWPRTCRTSTTGATSSSARSTSWCPARATPSTRSSASGAAGTSRPGAWRHCAPHTPRDATWS